MSITTTRKLSDDVLQSAEQAVESTRALANESLDQASSKVRELQSSLKPALDEMAERAQQALRRGLDSATETRLQAQKFGGTVRVIDRVADATGKYVSEQPVKSVLIAAATGAALAALLIAATRSGRN